MFDIQGLALTLSLLITAINNAYIHITMWVPCWYAKAKWCTYVSVIWAIIGSDNDLSHVWSQAIAGLLIGVLEAHFSEIWLKNTISYKKK